MRVAAALSTSSVAGRPSCTSGGAVAFEQTVREVSQPLLEKLTHFLEKTDPLPRIFVGRQKLLLQVMPISLYLIHGMAGSKFTVHG
jgi:hypothetical protein